MQEFVLSDFGWMLFIVVAFVVLIISMWSFFTARGTRVITRTGGAFSVTTRVRDKVVGSPSVIVAVIGVVFIACTMAMFSFYYQATSGVPYISTESGNLIFISVIVCLIVAMFSLGMAILKNLGAVDLWRKMLKAQGATK